MILTLIKETLKGKTLLRTLMNLAIMDYTTNNPLKGDTVDLGSKTDNMSYNNFAKKDNTCNITYTDLHPESENVKKIDLEKKFNISDKSYDMVLCFNTLEHIFNYQNLVSESARILKEKGVFIGSTPFLASYHPDPNDYFRYTHTALKEIFAAAGFEQIVMKPLGIGPFSTGLYNVVMCTPRILRPIFLIGVLCADKFLNLITGNRHTGEHYTLSYFFVFKKI